MYVVTIVYSHYFGQEHFPVQIYCKDSEELGKCLDYMLDGEIDDIKVEKLEDFSNV